MFGGNVADGFDRAGDAAMICDKWPLRDSQRRRCVDVSDFIVSVVETDDHSSALLQTFAQDL